MVDAQDSKSCEGNFMRVRVPPPVPNKKFSRGSFFVIFIYSKLN